MIMVQKLHEARFVVDAEGVKREVILDYSIWEELLTLLEDAEDAEEISGLRQADEETLSWDEAKAALRSEGVDV